MNTTTMNFDAKLSPREEQMTLGLFLGMAKKEIAHILNISVRTAENTIRNAMTKTGAKKSTDQVVWYMVTHFSIPIDQLPKSITAMIFLLLFFCATNNTRTIRSSRTRRNEVEYIIEA